MSTNPGFAFVVNSLLSTSKNSKLLSKTKKDSKPLVSETSKVSIEQLEFVSDNVTSTKEPILEIESKKSSKTSIKINRHEFDSIGRVKPKLEDKERDRKLTLIATKGVVQLFNVVKEQQKSIKHKLDEAGGSESKRSKVLSSFTEEDLVDKVNKTLDQKESKKVSHDHTAKNKWKVLRDDFMTGAKLKDWDRESDSDNDD